MDALSYIGSCNAARFVRLRYVEAAKKSKNKRQVFYGGTFCVCVCVTVAAYLLPLPAVSHMVIVFCHLVVWRWNGNMVAG